ncbi:MAG TPA: hypothetical protein VMU20_12765 [Candidatus Dormibacteraeota bacterium]|nr:hypothetical protein [Candidatus Dormibacteraeota bacterium]
MSEPPPDGLDLDLLAAQLRADTHDIASFVEVLAGKLIDILGDHVSVERAGGMFRRAKGIATLRVTLGEDVYEAARASSGWVCRHEHTVRGIRLRGEELDIDAWLTALVAAMAEEARRSARVRQALDSLLT